MSGVLHRNIFYTDNERPPGITNTLLKIVNFLDEFRTMQGINRQYLILRRLFIDARRFLKNACLE